MDELKQKVAKGSLWVLLEQCSVQGLNFGLGIILARLLSPSDYGMVALVNIFIAVATVLVNSGFGQALVQKKDVDDLDFTSVFYVGTAVALLLYSVLFFAAPWVARFYHTPELTLIVRILAISLFFYSINSVQNAELFRRMRFDVPFKISLTVTIVSGIVGVSLALMGFGVWSLVWSSIISSAVGVVVRAFFIRWRPQWAFGLDRIRDLFQFGWKMMVSGLLVTFVSNLHGMLIGKMYSRADLAMINRGQNIPNLLRDNIQVSLIEASFPAVSKLQDDPQRLREALRKLMVVSTFVIIPLMAAIAIVSPRMILFLYGAKWMPCVPYAQLTCIGAVIGLVTAVNLLAVQAIGRSDIFLKLAILDNVISVLLLVFVLPHGIMPWLAASTFVLLPVKLVVSMAINRRILGFGILLQLRDMAATIAVVAVAGGLLALSNLIPVGESPIALFVTLACQGIGFVAVCLGLAFAFRIRALREIAAIALPKLSGRFAVCAWLAAYLSAVDDPVGNTDSKA